MLYMLDTDICSYIMKQVNPELLQKLQVKVEQGRAICISVITYSELRLGAERSGAADKYNKLIDEFSERLDFIADWTTTEADCFAKLQARLLREGRPIGTNDTMIASHALCMEAVLITNNSRHFSRIPELGTENWVTVE